MASDAAGGVMMVVGTAAEAAGAHVLDNFEYGSEAATVTSFVRAGRGPAGAGAWWVENEAENGETTAERGGVAGVTGREILAGLRGCETTKGGGKTTGGAASTGVPMPLEPALLVTVVVATT